MGGKEEMTMSLNASEASTSKTGKRRMSKKERRALKKQKKHSKVEEQSFEKSPFEKVERNTSNGIENDEITEEKCLKSYEPIKVPSEPSSEVLASSNKKGGNKVVNDVDEGGDGGRTLGKWFPNALLIKCLANYTNTGQLLLNGPQNAKDSFVRVENPRSSLVLFYQYTKEEKWSEHRLKILMSYLSMIAKKRNIGGRIRVAQEGVNATISAVDMGKVSAKETLRHFAQDLRNFDSKVFAQTDFKYIDDLPADRHFKELKVIPVQELVFYGIKEGDAPLDGEKGGVHLDAKEYHEMLKKKNTVVIDVRNHYETIIGRFDGQQKDKDKLGEATGGAEYLDPLMRKSTDFKSWLAKDETQEKIKNKTVLMYCTGGIRCERASAYLKKEMGNEVDGVYQLQGGIERYLKEFPDGGHWRGKNFVFDKREAVGVGNAAGDGGVVRKQKKKKGTQDDSPDALPSICCVCGVKWDRYIGKKKCFTCRVPVLMCEKCMSLKPDKTPGMELKVRCPLCVLENITVPASEVEFTNNGIKGKVGEKQGKDKKVAGSVLKWGGGHASKKKLSRKIKGRMCQFGSECMRKDCFFIHPGQES